MAIQAGRRGGPALVVRAVSSHLSASLGSFLTITRQAFEAFAVLGAGHARLSKFTFALIQGVEVARIVTTFCLNTSGRHAGNASHVGLGMPDSRTVITGASRIGVTTVVLVAHGRGTRNGGHVVLVVSEGGTLLGKGGATSGVGRTTVADDTMRSNTLDIVLAGFVREERGAVEGIALWVGLATVAAHTSLSFANSGGHIGNRVKESSTLEGRSARWVGIAAVVTQAVLTSTNQSGHVVLRVVIKRAFELAADGIGLATITGHTRFALALDGKQAIFFMKLSRAAEARAIRVRFTAVALYASSSGAHDFAHASAGVRKRSATKGTACGIWLTAVVLHTTRGRTKRSAVG